MNRGREEGGTIVEDVFVEYIIGIAIPIYCLVSTNPPPFPLALVSVGGSSSSPRTCRILEHVRPQDMQGKGKREEEEGDQQVKRRPEGERR